MTSKLTSIADEKIEDVIKMARESAKIYGGEWDSALIAESPGNNVHGITSDHIEAVVVRTADDSLHSSWLCDYLESVSPAFVIAALRELQERRKSEKDSKPVAWTENCEITNMQATGLYLRGFPDNSHGRDIPLYRHAQQPVVPDESYQQLSDLYHAQEKRLFKVARRIKGPAFDKYSHSPSQAIDVLEGAIFGENNACGAAMLQAHSLHAVKTAPALGSLQKTGEVLHTNSPVIPDGWTGNDKANAALIMLDRIETVDPVDDDRIEGVKRIIHELAAAPQEVK
ncbi:TPA: hypothetical protein NIU90_000430 [Klebsiella oxytoca]|nr:hypothetical protein [Klebsiella oxytoca]